jgi:hypothetical protein
MICPPKLWRSGRCSDPHQSLPDRDFDDLHDDQSEREDQIATQGSQRND